MQAEAGPILYTYVLHFKEPNAAWIDNAQDQIQYKRHPNHWEVHRANRFKVFDWIITHCISVAAIDQLVISWWRKTVISNNKQEAFRFQTSARREFIYQQLLSLRRNTLFYTLFRNNCCNLKDLKW